jgi:syntaxin 18
MDITPIFNQVLAKHDARPIEPPVFRVEALDGFVKEAYRIVGHVARVNLKVKANSHSEVTLQSFTQT